MHRIGTIHFDASVAALLRDGGLPTSDLGTGTRVGFLGAAAGTRLLGCVGLEDCGDAVLLRSLAVARQARNAGLGTALLEAAEQRARELGHPMVYLLTTDAAPFFAIHGYRAVERADAPPGIAATAQFSGLCPSSSHFMGKSLQPRGG